MYIYDKLKKNQIEIVALTVFLSTTAVTECPGGKLPYSRTR